MISYTGYYGAVKIVIDYQEWRARLQGISALSYYHVIRTGYNYEP
jgi:hypothetical protein